jgi:hypothetical protein
MAVDPSLSKYERIGFPDSYRQGFEQAIFEDVLAKLPCLKDRQKKVADIGPGCSDLPQMLIELCAAQGHSLSLIDSQEMLGKLPEQKGIEKVAALFPRCPEWIAAKAGSMDAIICYSVLHYVFVDTNPFRFLDAALSLLAPGGAMLVGDIPNVSMRRRFFSSEGGVAFHKAFMKTDQAPLVEHNRLEPERIDDAVVFGLLERARTAGFDSYVLPQPSGLPMANRREDLLFKRP